MTHPPSFRHLISIVPWIQQTTHALKFRDLDRRGQMATGCFDLAIEHQAAISVLLDQQILGSAFALARVLSDSLVRGIWLADCAAETDLDAFQTNGLRSRTFQSLVGDIELKAGGLGATALSRLTGASWRFMCDFTHTGYQHVVRRHSDTHLGPNYPIAEIEQLARAACALGLMAAVALADLAQDRRVAGACMARLAEFVATRFAAEQDLAGFRPPADFPA